MHATEILSTLAAAGITVAAAPQPGIIHIGPRSRLTDEYRRLVIEHKPELLALLTRRPVPIPPLTPDERADVTEALEERAAIRQYDGGETRDQAEHEARSAMRVFRLRIAMPDGGEPRWVTMIAPGCTLEEARRDAVHRFGAERVLEVLTHGGPRGTP